MCYSISVKKLSLGILCGKINNFLMKFQLFQRFLLTLRHIMYNEHEYAKT